jgi:hypothetical protein
LPANVLIIHRDQVKICVEADLRPASTVKEEYNYFLMGITTSV